MSFLRMIYNTCDAHVRVIVVQMADDELLGPLVALAKVPHTLNHIIFRTLVLFTTNAKGIVALARLGIIAVIMDTLRRPQEPQCLRYRFNIL